MQKDCLRTDPTWFLIVDLAVSSNRWDWIIPKGLWELVEPLLPAARARPRGGGTANIDDEAVFAASAYVLVSGCSWRHLPPRFGISKSTVHRRFRVWSSDWNVGPTSPGDPGPASGLRAGGSVPGPARYIPCTHEKKGQTHRFEPRGPRQTRFQAARPV